MRSLLLSLALGTVAVAPASAADYRAPLREEAAPASCRTVVIKVWDRTALQFIYRSVDICE